MAGEPKFFSRNYLDSECYLASDDSDMTATLSRLYDRDTSLPCTSVGCNSDLIEVNIEIRFIKSGVEMNRVYDTVVLLGHNIAVFDVYYWNGSTWVIEPSASAEGGGTSATVITFDPRTASRLLIKLQTTQVADQEKYIGEILVMSTLFAFSTGDGPSSISFAPESVGTFTPTADRGVIVSRLKWAGARTNRFKARMAFVLLAKSDYDDLIQIVWAGECTLRLEPVERPLEFYHGTITPGGARSEFASTFKGNGYTLNLEFTET